MCAISRRPGQRDAGADGFAADVMAGTLAYGQLSVMPSMTAPLDSGQVVGEGMSTEQAKTIPEHFAPVYAASQADIDAVFAAQAGDAFALGSPQGMDAASVRLDLGTLASRSVGVFGASGSGKTFLARMLLAGLVKDGDRRCRWCSTWRASTGGRGRTTTGGGRSKGLKQLFPSRVVTFTLDEESSRRRGVTPDGVVRIGYDEIEPADIEVLRDLLNLSEVAAATAWNLERHYGKRTTGSARSGR